MVLYQQSSPTIAFGAFQELYERYAQRVYSYLLTKIENQADAEDLLQKIFIKLHESKHLYKNKFKFEQWLFVMARTSLIDFLRSSSRYQRKLEKLAEDQLSAPEINSPRREYDRFQSLSLEQKELLEMKYIDELSYEEISTLLDKSETSLRKMVSRLMINLRKGEV